MGMSASQARLLSITARLTNNEFRSQTITNSKLRLATESEEASRAYMDALNQKQLQFMYYDNNGNAQKVPMTGAFLSTYAPMKNQYSVINSAGKILVSHTDAENFENSNDLFEFLSKYDLVYDISNDINTGRHAEWEEACKKIDDDYKEKLEAWEEDPYTYTYDTSLYQTFADAVGTSQDPKAFCYKQALSGDTVCYLHLLNEILDFNGENLVTHTYRTSIGQSVTTNTATGGMWANTDPPGSGQVALSVMKNISDLINESVHVCDGADDFTPYYNSSTGEDILEGNLIQTAIDARRTPTNFELLVSDYTYDADTKTCTGLKTVKQKAIDLYYLIQNKSSYPEVTQELMKNTLINFTEGDLKLMVKTEKDKPEKPPYPPEPQNISSLILRDQEKSQWYTNLWFKMNGSDTANLVNTIDFDSLDYGEYIPDELKSEYKYLVGNAEKDEHKVNFEEFDGNLYTNSEWLEFALEHGLVTMQHAKYYNPSADSGKVMEILSEGITWQNIIHTEASDIISVDDEKAIAIAEAKYKKEITEIQNKDKKYDQDLKKLDTEHNALQTEYESIKEVISKNTERSFKAFS